MRKKLLEKEGGTEGASHQVRKLSATKSGGHTSGKAWKIDSEPLKQQENETQLQRKMEELQKVSQNIFSHGLEAYRKMF